MTVRTISNSIDLNSRQIQIQTFSASAPASSYANFQGSAYPAIDLTTDINPIQPNDYSSVWVGGAGKNLVRDGRFEDVANAWTNWGSPTTREVITSDGKKYLHIVSTSTSFEGYQQNETKRNGIGEITAGETITMQVKARGAASYSFNVIGVHWRDSSGTIVAQNWKGGSITTTEQTFSLTVTVPENAVAFNVMIGKGSSSTEAELWLRDVQIEKSSGATDWEPYENVCPISGSTEVNTYVNNTYITVGAHKYKTLLNRTVYGAIINVTKGLLTVTHGYKALDGTEEGWTKSSTYQGSFYISRNNITPRPLANTPFICSHADCVSSISNYAYGKCYMDSAVNLWLGESSWTVDDFKTYLANQAAADTPVQICYELAASETYQLTPQQVMLLQGTNNVWTDAGDMTVQYAIITDSAIDALREPISNASKTASSYITAMDEGGIKVHDAGDEDNYTKINSNGMQVYQDDIEVASFGSTARIGPQSDSNKVEIDNDRMRMIAYTGVPALDINIPEDGEIVPSYSETISFYRQLYKYSSYDLDWSSTYCTDKITLTMFTTSASTTKSISDRNIQQKIADISNGDSFMITLEISTKASLVEHTGIGKSSLSATFTKGINSSATCSYNESDCIYDITITYNNDTSIFDVVFTMRKSGSGVLISKSAYLDIYSITTIDRHLKNYMYMNGDLIACSFKDAEGTQFSYGDFGALGQNVLFHVQHNHNDPLYKAISDISWDNSVIVGINAYEPNNGYINEWTAYVGTDITTISAKTVPSDREVKWEIDDTSIATIQVDNFDSHIVTITPVSAGNCIIYLSMTILGKKYFSVLLLHVISS